MKVAAAILAAGAGTRFGGDKVSAQLRGKPVWRWSYDTFASHPLVSAAFVVVAPEALDGLAELCPHVVFVPGGADRPNSASKALEHCGKEIECLLVHDAARPFVSADLIERVVHAVEKFGAAAPGLPEVDTVREAEGGERRLMDRTKVFRMQTPQGARTELLKRAYDGSGDGGTDDMAFLESAGISWEMVSGEEGNFKITTREDLARAATMMHQETRTGLGYDIHPFANQSTRRLVLGGVIFPGEVGLYGHSDADVVVHAAVDALLGAAGLGDIGQHFPNTDPKWKGEPSTTFLKRAAELVMDNGWAIVNLDISVIAEKPRIMGRSQEMRQAMADVLGIEASRVSLKATTNERLGSLGRGEGIAAFAVATIRTQ